MKVSDIPRCLQIFNDLFPNENGFKADYSKAWHPNKSEKDDSLRIHSQAGVYLYSEPSSPEWDIPFEKNNQEIWYIGQSSGSVRRRVWANLGAMYDENGAPCKPMFKNNRWAKDDRIKDGKIKKAISEGKFVAYSIEIEPLSSYFATQIIETFLLTCFYRSSQDLPALNSLISQFKISR